MFAAKPKTKLSHPHDPEITRIYNSLIPKPAELVSVADRRFVREGDLTIFSERSKHHRVCHFFLFNDVMLQTTKEGSKKYKLEIFINLRFGLQVGDVPDSTYKIPNVEFRLYTRQKTVFLFAICEEDKHLWLSDLKQCINGSVDERFPELPKHPNQNNQQQQQQHQQQQQQEQPNYSSSYYADGGQETERIGDDRNEPSQILKIEPMMSVSYNPQPQTEYMVLSYPPIAPPGQYSAFQSNSPAHNDAFDDFASRAVKSSTSTNPFSSQSNFVPEPTFWDPTIASEFAQPFVSSTFVPQTTARFDGGESTSPFVAQPVGQAPPSGTPIFDPTTDPNNPFNDM